MGKDKVEMQRVGRLLAGNKGVLTRQTYLPKVLDIKRNIMLFLGHIQLMKESKEEKIRFYYTLSKQSQTSELGPDQFLY